MNKIIYLLVLITVSACNVGGKRYPANDAVYLETDEPVAFAQLKLSSMRRGLNEIAEKSSMIKSVNRFEMDPVTRILSVNLTVDYPLESLFNFTKIPNNDLSDLHNIELAVSFPESKTLAHTRYLGLTFHKFQIDGDDYIDAFEIVAAVVQTILANSELVDYLYTEHQENLPEGNFRLLLQEVLDENGIVIFHTTKKINFKLDLGMIAHLSPYIADYENLRLWRFSPTLFEGQEVRFKMIAGEGKPTARWMESQEARITEDSRTLLQVRNDLYQEFSDIENIEINNQNYLNSLLANELINRQKIPQNYRNEINRTLTSLRQQAQEVLSRQNESFIADPEYEYIQFTHYCETKLRNFVADLDRRLSIDEAILAGGTKDEDKSPLLTKMISQDLLNAGMNFLTDIEIDKNQVLTEAQMWLMPQLPGLGLKGKIHLPLEYLLGMMDQSLTDADFESKITDSQTGFPVELILEAKMADNGVLGLDIKTFKIQSGEKKLSFDRTSKNHQFLIDIAKIYLAQTLSSLKLDTTGSEVDDLNEQNREILSYLTNLKTQYNSARIKKLNDLIVKDLTLNPFNNAGAEHIQRKKEILLGELFSYNEGSKLFEMKLDPNIVVDKINNVKHNLQVWGVTPIYSKELNNTFLEMAVGNGMRPQKYIDELYFRGGQAENSQFGGVYLDLGNEQSTVDMLFSLNFKYLKAYLNQFLADMVKLNSTDIEQQAKQEPGESFFEVSYIDINITSDKRIMMDLKIKSAKYSRTWTSWLNRKMQTDTYSISSEIELQSKIVNIGANTNLHNLKYFPQALSIIPKRVKIQSGNPSLVNRAMTALINTGARIALNNGTFKKLLLKIVNKSFQKMYQDKSGVILGHTMEKIARLQTTNEDMLVFLNPKLAGAAFDVHLTANEDRIGNSLILDTAHQTLHIAFSSGAAMAKNDKKQLLRLLETTRELMAPLKEVQSKEQLIELLKDHQLVGKLIENSDLEKMSVYKKYIGLLRKYDQVLHSVDIPHAQELKRTRISASGSELMYFAGVAYAIQEELNPLIKTMQKYELTGPNLRYPTFLEAHERLNKNILEKLKTQYEKKNHRINQTVINNDISYWTYLVYPDSLLAEEVYSIIK